MMGEVATPPPFREAFYVTTYRDSMAVNDPNLASRGKRRHGPFPTCDEAKRFGEHTPDISHFAIDKVFVGPLVPIDWHL